MYRTIILLVWLVTSSSLWANPGGYVVSGKLHLDSSWSPVIYLSMMESLDELTTISHEMIIASASVDRDGRFVLEGTYLPEDDYLYRVHVCKQGDPISTIIIGGREHNHLHFVMHAGDSIDIRTRRGEIFGGASAQGNTVNQVLAAVQRIQDEENRDLPRSRAQAQLRVQQSARELGALLERTEHTLGRLYIAHLLLARYDDAEVTADILPVLRITMESGAPYAVEVAGMYHYRFPEEIPRNRSQLIWLFLAVVVAVSAAGLFIHNQQKQPAPDPVAQLSIQERRVLALLTEGMSNKEISHELSIGVSTVKSHVHSIYRKLKINSRQEVYRFRNSA